MKSVQKILCLCMSFLLMLSIWLKPVSAIEVRKKTEILQKIDDYVKSNMKVNHIKGAALAISNKDGVFYTKGYGSSSDGRAITSRTPFPIASLSKSFTALAVLQLVDKGLIDLDAPYTSYFPEISPKDERVYSIKVRDLLNQTSGLNDKVDPDMTNFPQYVSLQEINQTLNKVRLSSNPGTSYSYHNPNYQYLALLVEKVSGQSFSSYLENNIFYKLGMSHSFNLNNSQQINENSAIPRGHFIMFGHAVSKSEPSWFIEGPAGIISTADDMAKWMFAQYNDHLLSPELMGKYHSSGPVSQYGIGWMAKDNKEWGRTISHSGIFWTYKSEETIYLDQHLGITMMFNSGLNAFVDYAAFIDGIARIINGKTVESSYFNSRNMEIVMILLVITTSFWGVRSVFRINRIKKSITFGKLILSSVIRLLPIWILLFLSPITTFIGAGRVVPWFGLWTTMPSIIIWLAVLSLINVTYLVNSFRVFYRSSKRNFLSPSLSELTD
ncbi:serine hydrolase domain-containing protein [Fictibacillus phosphorivorans]|uniref:serine hydrolase domain-containing protein n=1 Tax=Fictibacillus phosphorivorans TaxID=1221500 RepID=UPI00203A7690|nr:serine hydrolase domain-containing protein [Fictibacillus phosphorivorans]MCM3718704.1 beta-lactamase family protein [Fictibacillus phosphorivorans]MCM3776327.1 beta-lactamase family protein [Fictibacillus phosphorivorans]